MGDTSPELTGVVYSSGEDGVPVLANLTGATVMLHLRKPSAVVVTVTAAISTPATDGRWVYAWDTAIDEAGLWLIEGQVTFASGRVQTFGPNAFRVQPAIA